ncbi:hypothetical protein Q3G72_009983 [Acer saccharum]|nr:hypothetical protein Q3G72_009983 [Acer saccharum]
MVRAFIAVEKELAGRVAVESEFDRVVPDSEEELVQTTTVNEELGRATIVAVDSVEEDASTVITQVQEGLGVEELSTETICHEQVSSKRGRSNSNTFSKHRMKTRSSKLQCSGSNQTVKPSQRTRSQSMNQKASSTIPYGWSKSL